MASAELQAFPLKADALVARLPLLAQLADFHRALNEQFDDCRHAGRYRPGQSLRRLRGSLERLCRLQEDLLHPALAASHADPWPALQRAREDVASLRKLLASAASTDEARQPALLALLEGVAQLQFVSLDELLAEADPAAMPWSPLGRATAALLG